MISDGAAAAIDPAMSGMTLGIMLGCAAVMFFIPFAEYIRNRGLTLFGRAEKIDDEWAQ